MPPKPDKKRQARALAKKKSSSSKSEVSSELSDDALLKSFDPSLTVQWYPGHIAKFERVLSDKLKLVDVVVLLLDARLPLATMNQRLYKQLQSKPLLLVLNKDDLADPRQTKRWIAHYKEALPKTHQMPIQVIPHQVSGSKHGLIQAVIELGQPRIEREMAKGLKTRSIRVLVCGMPNVGKSSLINHIVGKAKTQTGHKAGVTRNTQWIRIHPKVDLMDSPGLIPPVLEGLNAGPLLATVSSVSDATFDDESIAGFLLQRLDALYPGHLQRHFKIAPTPEPQPVSLAAIAEARQYRQLGNVLDERRAALALLTEYRQGRLWRITLEHPEIVPVVASDVSKNEALNNGALINNEGLNNLE